MPRAWKPVAFVLALVFAVSAARAPATLATVEAAPSRLDRLAAVEPAPMVKQAFDLLMDRFVIPPTSPGLLNAGWDAAVASLKEKGADVPEERPAFTGRRESDWRLFASRYAQLAEAANGKLGQEELDRTIVAAMARSLEEGHTAYLTPEEFSAATAQLRQSVRYAGVGAAFNRELVVLEVFEGSPAQVGGVRPGDQLIKVDGVSVEGGGVAEISARVRGEAGTPVELTFRRHEVSEPVVFTLIRAEINIAWLAHRVLPGAVGYLRIRTFPGPEALGEFRRAMERFDEAGIESLVIDVRGNGGGVIDTGIEIASRFIRNGPLYQQVDRRGGQRTVTAFGDYWDREIPIAVLADGGSGSMSEILASALQENGVARVFGTRTAGSVAGANLHRLVDGSGLSVTVWVIRSGQGKTLNNVGLEPDEVIELDPAALRSGRDNQLDAALDYVRHEAAARAAAAGPVGAQSVGASQRLGATTPAAWARLAPTAPDPLDGLPSAA